MKSPFVPLSRPAASTAVEAIGWRYLLATLVIAYAVGSLSESASATRAVVAGCGDEADGHLRIDVRPDRVELSLQTRSIGAVTEVDVDLAGRIATIAGDLGLQRVVGGPRPPQMLEIAIDTLDAEAIRPFWKAVLGYTDEPSPDGPGDGLVDPAGQMPTVWFQDMDEPRPQRNRIHFDLTVAHDEADERVAAALNAGGVLLSDDEARAFWILAAAQGNEVCVCTWQDRD